MQNDCMFIMKFYQHIMHTHADCIVLLIAGHTLSDKVYFVKQWSASKYEELSWLSEQHLGRAANQYVFAVFCTFFKGKYGSMFLFDKIRFFEISTKKKKKNLFFFLLESECSEIYTHYLCYEKLVRVFE